LADSVQAELLQRFFKTGKGGYGEGDIFLGIKVPVQRAVAKKYDLELNEIQRLLSSKIHEHRLVGLVILMNKYKKYEDKKKIFDFYLKNVLKGNVNNWDLVDLSAHKILGNFLIDKNRDILYKLAKSEKLWEKRVSIISCFAFIDKNDFVDALKISEILLKDEHDLIHKAVGWVLREIGKKDMKTLEDFLRKYYKVMPRIMLRYAIEKFPEDLKQDYLKSRV
jgi:3-methyladenine DNA glycosylase AlkD